MVQNSLLPTLQKLGLTYYEAKAYISLMTLGVAKPSVIAEESGVPRTKIYEVLKKLEKDKWVTVEKSRPAMVTPTYPRKVLEEHKLLINNEIDSLSNELAMIYDDVIQKDVPKIRVVYSQESIKQMALDVLGNAKNRIVSMGSLYLPGELEALKDSLLRAKERGVSIRIISKPLEDLDKEMVDGFNEFVDVKAGHPYCLKTIMVDNRETLLIMAKVENGVPNLEDVIAVWITSPQLTSYMWSIFDRDWKYLEDYRNNK
ncbi:TrmB family transcriptional regulator [Methanobacterium aggregans]|uniref:TrmB family transcriptional regulator n=1 Tax=Methanobacterium aggregans TaxID=1615586 RepID=UPI001AE5E52B|nr:TrmB family transcriptional regulator [Methanobacterium aggregans]MBP2044883.1 sugar-specific transcriptional regulator TrmB [Methanobacterium aggregans]